MALSNKSAVTPVLVTSAVPVTLLEPSDNRDGFILFNPTGILFVKLAKYCDASNYSYRLTPNTTLELFGYSGYLSAIAAAGFTSDVLVTELF